MRPLIVVGENCLVHWSSIPCIGCVYDDPAYSDVRGRTRYRLAQPFRALFYRLFSRIEYPADWNDHWGAIRAYEQTR